MLAGLMLTGCGSSQVPEKTPTVSAAAAVTSAATIKVPAMIGLNLDTATDQLVDLGLKVEAKDIENGKSIFLKKNWEVVTQDPGEGAGITKGSTVQLGVRHVVKETPTPTPTPPAPVTLVAPVAPPVVVAPPAPVAPVAPVVPVAPKAPVAPVAPKAPVVPVAPAPPNVGGGTIICNDGYVWPGTTRQGACRGHKGIRN